jgi:hypothetical protein
MFTFHGDGAEEEELYEGFWGIAVGIGGGI